MNYTIDQIAFILYNNRSINGVVKNFIDKNINFERLIDIEKKFDWCKSIFKDFENSVEVDSSLLNLEAEDITLFPEQLEEVKEHLLSKLGLFSDEEQDFLSRRKIDKSIIDKYQLLGLSQFKDNEHLIRIGATCHPILNRVLKDGIDEGGIVMPLFKNDKLVNCNIRRITDVGKLKYTLAVPDISVWGLDNIEEGDEVVICEGVIDMFALENIGYKVVCPCGAVWSGIQLLQFIEKNPSKVTIFCDNDMVGLKNGLILSKFFNLEKIPSNTIRSMYYKDPAEHFLENGKLINDIEEVSITRDMILSYSDNSFDFLKYLQKRKF